MDLANAHVKAIEYLNKNKTKPLIVNIGTGKGYSVLDVVKAFEKASGKKISYKIVDRRPGDVAKVYADPSFAKKTLNWQATRDLNKMCEDSWRWQNKNPNGYEEKI
jgi:UDP-glucose 4-epimerase